MDGQVQGTFGRLILNLSDNRLPFYCGATISSVPENCEHSVCADLVHKGSVIVGYVCE